MLLSRSSLLLALSATVVLALAHADETLHTCDYYLAPSKISYLGRGIFAGRSFSAGEIFQNTATVVISDDHALQTQLAFYVYGMSLDEGDTQIPSEKDNQDAMQKVISMNNLEKNTLSQFVFGPALLVNDGPRKQVNMDSFWPNKYAVHPDVSVQFPHTVSPNFGYKFSASVEKYHELFVSYGGMDWFEERDIPYNNSLIHTGPDVRYETLEELEEVGVCLSDVYLNDSAIPLAGRGVFVKRSFKKGEVVTISPVIVTSRDLAVKDNQSVLLNYVLSRSDTDMALLPVALAGMLNHAHKNASNLHMQWGAILNGSHTLEQMLAMHPRELARLPYAPLDIEYVATKDIAAGDELTIFYGVEWERAWLQYLDELSTWRAGSEGPPTLAAKPVFRRHIEIPEHMLPESGSFLVDCVSVLSDCDLTVNRLKLEVNSMSTFEASRDFISNENSQRKYLDPGGSGGESQSNGTCDVYLAPSRIPFLSRGVFAGRDFHVDDVLESTASVSLLFEHASRTQLAYYVYSMGVYDYGRASRGPMKYSGDLEVLDKDELVTRYAKSTSQFAFGASLLMNHAAGDEDVQSFYASKFGVSPIFSTQHAHTLFADFGMYFETDLSAGQEILTTYGNKNWFSSRGIEYNSTVFSAAALSYESLDELDKVGVCLSDLYLKESSIPLAGRGVFSKRFYKKGDVVTISPAIVTSRDMALNDSNSIIVNFLLSRSDTDLALLPATLAGMINHAGNTSANLVLEWSADAEGLGGYNLNERLSMHPRELAALSSAPFDISYVADKDIAAGDELTIFYGAEWERAWLQYLDELSTWRAGSEGPPTLAAKPVFRRHIEIPEHMLPESGSFLVDCVVADWECDLEINKIRLPENSLDSISESRSYIADYNVQQKAIEQIGASLDSSSYNVAGPQCKVYLAPSQVSFWQRGVYAGVDYYEEDGFENAPTIALSTNHANQSQLWYYVHGSRVNDADTKFSSDMTKEEFGQYNVIFEDEMERREDIVFFIFGAASLLNHAPESADVRSCWASEILTDPNTASQSAHTHSPNIGHVFNNEVGVGYEITKAYESDWFDDRPDVWYDEAEQLEIDPQSLAYESIDKLAMDGICLSDLYVMASNIPMAGRGVFSQSSYKKGEIVTTSPVIVTSRDLAMKDDKSVLMNYLMSRSDTDLALLPVTLAGMLNHAGEPSANLHVRWSSKLFNLNKTIEDRLVMHPRELARLPYAPLDIEYVATKDIAAGDELTIFYGVEWERAWLQYLDELSTWRAGSEGPPTLAAKPVFRRHIEIPEHMLPESGSFLVDCVLSDWDCDLQVHRLNIELNSLSTIQQARDLFGEQCDSGLVDN